MRARRQDLKKIEDLGAILEEHLILDNRYTEHSTVGLAQQWDQLDQLGMRMQHNLEQQIQARNQSGVSEDALKEFSMMFKHFDKDKSGRLNHQEFKSCLRALGYDLPMMEEGQPDPEFENILGFIIAFHILLFRLFQTFNLMPDIIIRRHRGSEQRWLRIVARIHGLYDQQGNGERAKLGGNRERFPSHHCGRSAICHEGGIICCEYARREILGSLEYDDLNTTCHID